MRKLRKIARTSGLVLVVLLVVGGSYLGYVVTGNSFPRTEAEGWLRLKDMPRPRGETGATFAHPGGPGVPDICPDAPCAPQLFVVGGLSGLLGRTVREVDILDAGNGEWREGPRLPEPRHHPAAASIAGAVYVSGGSKKATRWAPESNLWVLRPGSDEWDPLPEMPEGRMGHALVDVEGKLYVIGGRGDTSRVLVYDLERGWSAHAEMPEPRDHLGAAAVGGKIYAIGGRNGGLLSRVDVYDVASDSWTPGPDMPAATSGMAAAYLPSPGGDDRIHVVGGEDPGVVGGSVVDRHFVLDPTTGTWSTGPKALLAVHGAAADQVAGILVIAGGSRRQGGWSVLAWTGVTQRFNPRDAPATPTAPTPTPTGTQPAPTVLPS